MTVNALHFDSSMLLPNSCLSMCLIRKSYQGLQYTSRLYELKIICSRKCSLGKHKHQPLHHTNRVQRISTNCSISMTLEGLFLLKCILYIAWIFKKQRFLHSFSFYLWCAIFLNTFWDSLWNLISLAEMTIQYQTIQNMLIYLEW